MNTQTRVELVHARGHRATVMLNATGQRKRVNLCLTAANDGITGGSAPASSLEQSNDGIQSPD